LTTHRVRLSVLALALALFGLMRMLPAPAGLSADGWAVAALAAVMAMLWLSGALPLALTSVLPFILLPLMGVMKPAGVAGLYWSPVIFLVLGGAIIAVAVETHQLHRRLALAVVARAPASPRGLVVAFMAATALVSMGVSNTATAFIMMPVALAVAGALAGPASGGAGLVTAMVLGVAYAANIGGLGTLVGTPTNAISAGIVERSLGLQVDFLTWLAFGVPLVLLAIPATALILIALFRVPGGRLDREELVTLLGRQGALTPDQKRLLPLLALLLLGWVVWPLLAVAFKLPAPDDGMVAMAVSLLLFIVPSAERDGALLDWKATTARLPWDILLLFGGGLALAGAITDSGLAAWIGAQLSALEALPTLMLALLVVGLVVLVTEFASNVAAASAFMPVVAAVAVQTGTAPLPLVMASAFAATWGFMMPSGTPPNAIAFATGHVSIGQMVRAGFFVNLLGILLMVGVSFGVAALLG
jgi:sodium-dependent dicarboxylate transporter 2/3/5